MEGERETKREGEEMELRGGGTCFSSLSFPKRGAFATFFTMDIGRTTYNVPLNIM